MNRKCVISFRNPITFVFLIYISKTSLILNWRRFSPQTTIQRECTINIEPPPHKTTLLYNLLIKLVFPDCTASLFSFTRKIYCIRIATKMNSWSVNCRILYGTPLRHVSIIWMRYQLNVSVIKLFVKITRQYEIHFHNMPIGRMILKIKINLRLDSSLHAYTFQQLIDEI